MSNGYIKLKVTLPPTKISRTIVVPGDMTLDYLNDAIQAVMGCENCHLCIISNFCLIFIVELKVLNTLFAISSFD